MYHFLIHNFIFDVTMNLFFIFFGLVIIISFNFVKLDIYTLGYLLY